LPRASSPECLRRNEGRLLKHSWGRFRNNFRIEVGGSPYFEQQLFQALKSPGEAAGQRRQAKSANSVCEGEKPADSHCARDVYGIPGSITQHQRTVEDGWFPVVSHLCENRTSSEAPQHARKAGQQFSRMEKTYWAYSRLLPRLSRPENRGRLVPQRQSGMSTGRSG